MTETVLVTGGSGFVAGWCLVELLRRGYAVRATVRDLAKGEAVRAAVATEVDPGDRLTFAAADLTSDEGWDAAVAGCAFVLHVATPMQPASEDADAYIRPAREGTLRVLAAASRAGVKRVVYTSSTAACAPLLRGPDSLNNETSWTDLSDKAATPYRQSKAIAERAAWDFIAERGGATELTTVLPSAIFGPILSPATLGSVMVIGRLLSGRMPGTPRIGFSVVDVRDLADAHIRAMTAPEAEGERFIACGDFLWMADIARELRSALGERAAKVPTKAVADAAIKLAAAFDRSLRAITPTLGRRHAFNSAKAQRLLGWRPRPAAETVVDCGRSLLDFAVV